MFIPTKVEGYATAGIFYTILQVEFHGANPFHSTVMIEVTMCKNKSSYCFKVQYYILTLPVS